MPGIDDDARARDARRLARGDALRQPLRHVERGERVAGRALHRRRLALHVHEHDGGAGARHRRHRPVAARARVTSLTMRAPAASAVAITSAWRVSTETTAPAAARPRTTGSMRRSSSSGGTGVAPGRVNSPPISMMSAPAASERAALGDRGVGIEERAAVGKTVGRDVEHAHHQRPVEREARPRAGAPRRHGRELRARRRRRAPRPASPTHAITASPRRASISTAVKAAGPPASGSARPRATASRAAPPARRPSGRSQALCAAPPKSVEPDPYSVLPSPAVMLPASACCAMPPCRGAVAGLAAFPIYRPERRFGVSSLNLGRASRGPFFLPPMEPSAAFFRSCERACHIPLCWLRFSW